MLDKPITPYAGTSGHSGSETSRQRALARDNDGRTLNTQTQVLNYVRNAGRAGATIKEIRENFPDQHHGTLSGALTTLHQAGKIWRLLDRRNRCAIYVHPQSAEGRNVAMPKAKQMTPKIPHVTLDTVNTPAGKAPLCTVTVDDVVVFRGVNLDSLPDWFLREYR